MASHRSVLFVGALFGAALAVFDPSLNVTAAAPVNSILNASYDVSRELYKDIDRAFVAEWKAKTGSDIDVRQSHGGSTKQAQAVAEGLEADVVTLNQPTDLDFLVSRGVVAENWKTKFPNGAAPYTTTMIFIVRKGNPKGIKDWDDLAKPGISVVVPNPKTSGNGRYSYVAAWGYALDRFGSDEKARDFVGRIFANVPVFDGGGRGATTTFTQRDIGDVLVTFENEAVLVTSEVGAGNFETVYPSESVEAAPPIALVEPVVAKHGSKDVAEAYLNFLYSDVAQQIIAKHHFRPRNNAVVAGAGAFPPIKTFDAEGKIGPWADIQKTHFSDGGVYDQITIRKGN